MKKKLKDLPNEMFSEKEIFIGIGILIIIGSLLAFYFVLNSEDKINSKINLSEKQTDKSEGGITGQIVNIFSQKETNYCGDGYCYINENGDYENCNICSSDCGTCGDSDTCGDKICSVGECNTCFSDCSLLECENGICEKNNGENCLETPNDCKCGKNEVCDINNKICISHEKEETIIEEVIEAESPDKNYPILFVHGHSFANQDTTGSSLKTFYSMEQKFINDNLAFRGESIFPNHNLKAGVYRNKGKPVTFLTTYYSSVLSPDGVFVNEDDTESIRIYGTRLTEVIKEIKKATGKNKVNIVAHSMGGLVSREHIRQTNGEHVNNLIMIATPNNGVWRRDIQANVWLTLGQGCVIGHAGKECDDMLHDSNFLTKLNNEKENEVKIFTIAGKCGFSDVGESWDNVVRVKSVELNNAIDNYVYLCKNENKYSLESSFHNAMLNPNEVPDVYNKVIEFLKN